MCSPISITEPRGRNTEHVRHGTEAERERGDSSYMLGDVESVLDNCTISGEVVKDKRMR